MRRFYGKPKVKKHFDEQMFEKIVSLIPRSTVHRLKAIASERSMAVSRLICIAIDNELDASHPFYYPAELPDSPYVENGFAAEAGKVLELVRKMGASTTRETLLLSRREVELLDRRLFMQGYRELLMAGMITEREPKKLRPGQAEGFKLVEITPKPDGSDTRVEHSKRLLKPPTLDLDTEE